MSIRQSAVAVVVAAIPVLSVHASPTPPDTVRFVLRDGGAVIVPVFVDGQGPHSFLLDTGANRSAVLGGLARGLGLAAVARMVVVTPAGEETRAVVRLGRVSMGVATADGLLVSVVGADRLRLAGAEVMGILGQDFLSRFDYTLDYERRILVWGVQAPGRDGVRLALHRSEGRFLVDLPQRGDGARPMRFVPDSGTNGLVVFERAGGVPLSMEPLPRGSELESSSGQRRAVEMRRIRSLRIGDFTLRDQVAAVVSRPEADAPEGDGLLPLHHFASVTFGSQAGYLIIRSR